jgi:hypothetical protein
MPAGWSRFSPAERNCSGLRGYARNVSVGHRETSGSLPATDDRVAVLDGRRITQLSRAGARGARGGSRGAQAHRAGVKPTRAAATAQAPKAVQALAQSRPSDLIFPSHNRLHLETRFLKPWRRRWLPRLTDR